MLNHFSLGVINLQKTEEIEFLEPNTIHLKVLAIDGTVYVIVGTLLMFYYVYVIDSNVYLTGAKD